MFGAFVDSQPGADSTQPEPWVPRPKPGSPAPVAGNVLHRVASVCGDSPGCCVLPVGRAGVKRVLGAGELAAEVGGVVEAADQAAGEHAGVPVRGVVGFDDGGEQAVAGGEAAQALPPTRAATIPPLSAVPVAAPASQPTARRC